MKLKIRILLTFIGLLGISSCGIYRQNVVNVPIIQQKGQAQIGGYSSFMGLDAQASYALTNKLALMANYSDRGEDKRVNSTVNYEIDKHRFGELGIGYFKKTPKGKFVDYFFLAGQGKTSHFVQGGNGTGQITTFYKEVFYNRYCFQADFGTKIDKFEYAYTPGS